LDTPEGVEGWLLSGSLFFGSVSKLNQMTDPKRLSSGTPPRVVILDCHGLLNIDNSAMDIIHTYYRALKRRGCEMIICGAADHTLRQLQRTGIAQDLGKNMVLDIFDAERLARQLIREQK
jgi:SulP family sulfate permease